ncbi:endonuclease/exonuclease/phosphatase family protein [Acinetobacter soli]|uniref:endonuclease/exonuclease/phosphatase family protein n=1 Tax=Acinetobacter soli TaxID=487316 RepID=UPI001D1921A2|nr:endonuclease/exonuclease/phosphatase family protein [Acinetobacter soli]
MIKSELFVGFWNVNLSPPLARKWNNSSESKRQLIALVIDSMLKMNLDFLCLCEISPEDIEFIDQSISLIGRGYDYKIKYEPLNGLYFDTCVIYKNSFEFIRMGYQVDGENRDKIKNYQKYEFNLPLQNERLILYVAHWLSKLRDNSERRRSVASYTRKDILDEKEKYAETKFIVLGDFNVEPYDTSIIYGLKSSRDKAKIMLNPSLLYNPFWKFLPIQKNMASGTHYYKKDEYHQWHVYDQILISGNFFKDGWDLDDNNVQILDDKAIISLVPSLNQNPSDHLPVLTKLEKENEI